MPVVAAVVPFPPPGPSPEKVRFETSMAALARENPAGHAVVCRLLDAMVLAQRAEQALTQLATVPVTLETLALRQSARETWYHATHLVASIRDAAVTGESSPPAPPSPPPGAVIPFLPRTRRRRTKRTTTPTSGGAR